MILKIILQGTKGKGKRPAKTNTAKDREPKSKKAKKESSDSEDSTETGEGEEEIDFAYTATNKWVGKVNVSLQSVSNIASVVFTIIVPLPPLSGHIKEK